MQEFVVPKSMPNTFAIKISFEKIPTVPHARTVPEAKQINKLLLFNTLWRFCAIP